LGSIIAVMAFVLGGARAMADDAAPATNPDIVYGVGGPALADDEDGASLWSGLRGILSETTLSVGAEPIGGGETEGADAADAAYNARADIGLKGFTIGGRFTQWGEPAPGVEAERSYGVGASYNLDSLTVGIDWARGDYDEVFLDVGTGDSGDVIAFTSSYALRPGVRVNGLLEYSEQQPEAAGSDEGSITVGIGTLISF
jgi:hypothetical protein